MVETDHDVGFLLSLDGFEFRLTTGYVIKIEARLVAATKHRPQGVKYSLTPHDLVGQRIYGMDNAHGTRRQTESIIGTSMGAGKWPPTSFAGRLNYWRIFTAKWNEYS